MLSQTQQKLSFVGKIFEVLELNLKEQERTRINMKEIENYLHTLDSDSKELEEQMRSTTLDQEVMNELAAELVTLHEQKRENVQLKHKLTEDIEVTLAINFESLINEKRKL